MFTRYDWQTPEYGRAFARLLACSRERAHLIPFVRGLINELPAGSIGIDWGAGGGDLTSMLLERCQRVFAVEPAEAMRAALLTRCPDAQLLAGDALTARPPVAVDLALLSHVLYHIPDEDWARVTIRLAGFLTDRGVLAVVLKNANSGCNRMLGEFGAPRFDLVGRLAPALGAHPEFDFSFTRLPGGIETTSIADTLDIARFMLCDREANQFTAPPTDQQLADYVSRHFWDESTERGGWDYHLVVCLVRRNRHDWT
jgi:hypothetical protein